MRTSYENEYQAQCWVHRKHTGKVEVGVAGDGIQVVLSDP